MTTLQIKISGIEGDSVLIKCSSDKSAKPIDDYDAVAYQPKLMGYSNLDEFINGITPSLAAFVEKRDASESTELDISTWEGHVASQNYVAPVANLDANGNPLIYDTSAQVTL